MRLSETSEECRKLRLSACPGFGEDRLELRAIGLHAEAKLAGRGSDSDPFGHLICDRARFVYFSVSTCACFMLALP